MRSYGNSYSSNSRDDNNLRHSYHQNQRYNNNPNRHRSNNGYNRNSSNHQHQQRRSYGHGHNNHSHSHSHSNQTHLSLHSNNNNNNNNNNYNDRRTHNNPSHSNRNRNQYHNASNRSHHQQHRNIYNQHNNNNNNNNHHHFNSNQNQQKRHNSLKQQQESRSTANRSRNIRNLTTSHDYNRPVHSIPIPVVNLIDNTSSNISSSKADTPPITDSLETAMNELSFNSVPFKYDYRSKINFTFLCKKNDIKCNEFDIMDPNKIYSWKYQTEREKKTKVRDYMLPCLKLLNNLMCFDEAIDFILPPNDIESNPDFYQQFKQFDDNKNNGKKNMCFLWIQNLLKSDYYETVDDFANDIRLIWNNTFSIFGLNDHEWSKNALKLQIEFEKQMIMISRKIENAQNIFIENGNPEIDPLQKEYLNLDCNKKEINESLKKLHEEQEKNEELKINKNESSMDIDINNIKNIELTEKQKRDKYLSNIDTKNNVYYRSNRRKKASKQKLITPASSSFNLLKNNNNLNKINGDDIIHKLGIDTNDGEEGEIYNYLPLDDIKLAECDAWYEFVIGYNDMVNIENVIMIQEEMDNIEEFEKYKLKTNNNLQLDIKEKSAEIQNKIYNVLDAAKRRITKTKPGSLDQLRLIVERNNKQRKQRIASLREKKKKKIIDPYSNEAMKEKEIKEKEKSELIMIEEQEKEEMDQDSPFDDGFDDGLLGFDVHIENIKNIKNIKNVKPNNNNNNNQNNNIGVISKTDYLQKNVGYRPIRPSNVDQSVEINEYKQYNKEYKEYKSNSPQIGDKWATNYTQQQQNEEDIDFDF